MTTRRVGQSTGPWTAAPSQHAHGIHADGITHGGPMEHRGLLQGGAAEAVAAQLEGRLRAALKSRANPFSEAAPALAGQLGRPLLALFDRSFELRCRKIPCASTAVRVRSIAGMP